MDHFIHANVIAIMIKANMPWCSGFNNEKIGCFEKTFSQGPKEYPQICVSRIDGRKMVSLIYLDQLGNVVKKNWNSFEDFIKGTKDFTAKELNQIDERYSDTKVSQDMGIHIFNLIESNRIANRIENAIISLAV